MGYPYAKIIDGRWVSCDLGTAQMISWEIEHDGGAMLNDFLRTNQSSWVFP